MAARPFQVLANYGTWSRDFGINKHFSKKNIIWSQNMISAYSVCLCKYLKYKCMFLFNVRFGLCLCVCVKVCAICPILAKTTNIRHNYLTGCHSFLIKGKSVQNMFFIELKFCFKVLSILKYLIG